MNESRVTEIQKIGEVNFFTSSNVKVVDLWN